MRKRHLWIVLACLVLAALAVLASRGREPHYKGQALSEWLRIYAVEVAANRKNSPQCQAATGAVRAIGTKALPVLLKWIRQEPEPWRRTARKIFGAPLPDNPWLRSVLLRDKRQQLLAMCGFEILGTNAVPAIPELKLMMRDMSRGYAAGAAIVVLSGLGEQALPEMKAALADTNYLLRSAVAYHMTTQMAPDIGTNKCLPPLFAAMNDPDLSVRSVVSNCVERLTAATRTNAPAP